MMFNQRDNKSMLNKINNEVLVMFGNNVPDEHQTYINEKYRKV